MRREITILFTAISLVFAGCSVFDSDDEIEKQHEPVIIEFTIDPGLGYRGDMFLFSWKTEGADRVRIEPSISDPGEDLPVSGQVSRELLYSSWYTLTAENDLGSVSTNTWVEVRYREGSNWPLPRADRMNTGRSSYPGPMTNTLKWVYDFDKEPSGTPIINHDGSVIVGGKVLTVINPDGSLKWRVETKTHQVYLSEDGTIHGVLAYQEGYVVPGTITAIHPDGTERWHYTNPDGHRLATLSYGPDGCLIVGSSHQTGYDRIDGYIYYLNKEGDLESRVSTEFGVSSIGMNQDYDIITMENTTKGYYSYLERFTYKGEENIWQDLILSTGYYAPVFDPNDAFYMFRDYGYLSCFGQTPWYLDLPPDCNACNHSPLALGPSGILYTLGCLGCTDDGGYGTGQVLYAIHPQGWIQWHTVLAETDRLYGFGSAVDSEEHIYVSGTSNIYAVNADGSLLWTYDDPAQRFNSLALSLDGTLYALAYDLQTGRKYRLYAFHD
ncbi:hypothetical protein JXQ70_18090 [bacterium]|nr:hypothetical protein [bacterium]